MKLSDHISSLFFPPKCCGCGEIITPNISLCSSCEQKRAHFSEGRGFCKVCGQTKENCICVGRHFFKKSVFAFFHESEVKNTVYQFKFRGKLFHARGFAKQMYDAAQESGILTNADFIVPVPMHPLNELRRGYNQADILAKEFSKISGVKYLRALKKLDRTETQHDLPPLERAGNIAGAFEVKKRYINVVNGRRIILVDDIMTTQATLNEAAKTLMIFEAEEVYVIAAAAARNKKRKLKR